MGVCDKDLKKNLVVNCEVPLARGVSETIFTGRFRDLDTATYDLTNKKIITGITLKTGKKLKHWIGQNFSNQVQVGMTSGEYGNTYPQTLRYVLFSNDADDEAEIDNIGSIKDMFAIVQKNGNPPVFKAYGWRAGLRLSNLASDSNDETLKGAYVMDFTADESQTPYTFRHMTTGGTPVEDSLVALEALALALT